MKNLKVKLSVMAVLLGAGSAFAGMTHKVADRKWTQDASTGVYSPVTGTKGIDYDCNESSNRCTESYPQALDPNTNPAPGQPGHVAPTSIELGDFQ